MLTMQMITESDLLVHIAIYSWAAIEYMLFIVYKPTPLHPSHTRKKNALCSQLVTRRTTQLSVQLHIDIH